jgi:hypothetical protein
LFVCYRHIRQTLIRDVKRFEWRNEFDVDAFTQGGDGVNTHTHCHSNVSTI